LTKVDATDYNATWQENFADWTSQVKHTVKNNGLSGTITKGTAVYVTGSNGTNMLVGRASNASEATSSKTMGLMESNITTTGGTQTGFVVTEGLLQGLNTASATAGDPVWLGVNGALIYGLTNKPYAPAHLVFIGIVTKVSAGNGEIFVKVQNGFELSEIHTVDIITTTPINGHLLGFDGTLWVNKTIASWLGFTPVTDARTISTTAPLSGGGDLSANRTLSITQATTSTDGYLSSTNWNTFNNKFTLPALTSGSVLFSNGTTIAQDNANLFWDDTNNRLGIGTSTPANTLDVNGTARLNGSTTFGTIGTSTGMFWDNTNNGLALGGSTLDTNYILQVNGAKGARISGTGAGYGYSLVRGSETSSFANSGSGSGLSSTTNLLFNTASTERMRINSSGNVLINTTTDAGFKLDVNGTARVSGLMRSTDVFVVGGTATTNTANSRFWGSGGQAPTSGLFRSFFSDIGWIPSSGTAEWYGVDLRPVINQTGTATGITRGLYIAPTLTSVVDFRAIEVANGITILGAATTAKASLRIPSGTAPTSPTNGDIWFDGTNLKMQIGGLTKTFTLL